MNLPVTAKQLAACRAKVTEALVHSIRECGRSYPPADGGILRLAQTLDILDRVIPLDDPAGRGIGAYDPHDSQPATVSTDWPANIPGNNT